MCASTENKSFTSPSDVLERKQDELTSAVRQFFFMIHGPGCIEVLNRMQTDYIENMTQTDLPDASEHVAMDVYVTNELVSFLAKASYLNLEIKQLEDLTSVH